MAREDATARFYRLVWPHRATVLRTAQLLLRGGTEADDLAQETLIKAFRAMDQFEEGTDVRAWLMTILRRTRIDRLRASARQAGQVSLDALTSEPADERDDPAGHGEAEWHDAEAMLQAFSDEQVIQALRQLPEEIRWTLLLVDVERLDQQEAAAILEVPVGTVKSRAHRGRAMLREKLLPKAREMRLTGDQS